MVFFDIPASKFALCSFLGEEEVEEEGNAKTEEEEEEVSVTYISAVFFF